MRLRLLVALLPIVLVAFFVPPVDADVPAMDDGARRAHEAKLRRRGREWLRLKAKLRQICPRCGGRGTTRRRGGRYPGSTQACSTCKGRKAIVDGRVFLRVYHTYYSPAFRAQPGVKDRLVARWRSYAPHGRLSPDGREFIERFDIESVHLVDETHGVVRAWLDRHEYNPSEPTEIRWIWSSEKPGRTGRWYVHEPEADGPWPGSGALRPYRGARNLGARVLEDIREAWPDEALHTPTSLHRRGEDLVITLQANEGVGRDALRQKLHVEVMRAFGHAFNSKRWARVVIVAGGVWRNELGETDTKPYCVVELTRNEWMRLKPENLDARERMRAFDAQWMRYPGWEDWK